MDDDTKRVKGSENSKSRNKLLIILIAVAIIATAAIAVGTYIAVRFSNKSQQPLDVGEQTTAEGVSAVEKDTAESASGYPYEESEGAIESLNFMDNNLLVLSDGGLSLLDSNANELFSLPHSYSQPAVKVSDGRAILYDKASNQYKILDKNGELFNNTTQDGNIVTCDMSKSGRYVTVTSLSGSSSILSVHSKDGKETLFEWKCSPERIVSVSISPKGNNIAAGVLYAENGQVVSKVYLLDLDMIESPQPYICKSGAVLEVKYISEKYISVVTDSGRIIVNQSGEEDGYMTNVDSSLLRAFSSDDSGNTAYLIDSLDSVGDSTLYLYNKQNTQKYDSVTQKDAENVFCCSARVYLLCGETVICRAGNGEIIDELQLPVSCNMLCADGSTVYCSNGLSVYRLKCG